MSEIPVVIAFDENYLMPAGVMLTSLFENAGPQTRYQVYIFADALTRASAQGRIDAVVASYKGHSVEWLDPAGDFASAKNRNHLTTPNYYRFLIPAYLTNHDKALWIDVDMIIKRDLMELFNTNLDGMYLGAVKIGLHNAGVQHVPWDQYFNAGLLLMNLALWRRDDVAGRVRRLIAENDFSCPTQDPMNLIGFEKTVFLPVEYNVYLSPKSMKGGRRREYLDFHGCRSFEELISRAAVLHFVENIKPWNDAAHPEREEWLKYHRMSVFKDVPLHYVKRPSVVRKYALKFLSLFILDKKKRRKFRERIWAR